MTRRNHSALGVPGLLLVTTAFLTACNTTPVRQSTPARIDMPDAYGFTITEQARVDAKVRGDYERAVALLEQGDSAQGIELLQQVAEAAPQLSAPLIDLGIAYHRAGDLEAAEKHLKLALEANPRHPTAHNELGIVYRKTARFPDARRSYEAALDVYPGYHFARRNLGVLCDLYLADAQCALDNYEAYLDVVLGDPEVEMWLKDLRFRAGMTETP